MLELLIHGNSFSLETGLSDGLSRLKLSAVADLSLRSSPSSMLGTLLFLIHGSLALAEVVENDCLDSGLSFSSILCLASKPKELLVCVVPSLVFGLSNGDFLTEGDGPKSVNFNGTDTVDIELLAPPGLPKGLLDATDPCLFSVNSCGVLKLVGPKLGLANGLLGANLRSGGPSSDCLGVVLGMSFSEDFDLANGGLSSSCGGGAGLKLSTEDDDSSPLR